MNFLQTFAETAETDGGLFGALGIDWRLLILQIVAFLIMVWVLGKFVYPWLMQSVDERQANIEAAAKAAKKAEAAAAESQEETASLLAQARKEAADIVATAKLEATNLANATEKKAKATDQLEKDVATANRELHYETLELVAIATGKVVGKTHTADADQALIKEALKGAK